MDGKSEALTQFLGEFRHFLRLCAFFPAHAQRITYDDLLNFILVDHALKAGEVGTLVSSLESFDALSGDSEGIGNGEPHASRAMIDCQYASCGHGGHYRGSPTRPKKHHRRIPPK